MKYSTTPGPLASQFTLQTTQLGSVRTFSSILHKTVPEALTPMTPATVLAPGTLTLVSS